MNWLEEGEQYYRSFIHEWAATTKSTNITSITATHRSFILSKEAYLITTRRIREDRFKRGDHAHHLHNVLFSTGAHRYISIISGHHRLHQALAWMVRVIATSMSSSSDLCTSYHLLLLWVHIRVLHQHHLMISLFTIITASLGIVSPASLRDWQTRSREVVVAPDQNQFMSPWGSCSRLTYYHHTRSSPDSKNHHIARRARWMQPWISGRELNDCSGHESRWDILRIASMNFSGWLEYFLEFSNRDHSFEFRWLRGESESGMKKNNYERIQKLECCNCMNRCNFLTDQ